MQEFTVQILTSHEISLKCVCPVKRKDCRREIHIGLDEKEGLQVCGHDLTA